MFKFSGAGFACRTYSSICEGFCAFEGISSRVALSRCDCISPSFDVRSNLAIRIVYAACSCVFVSVEDDRRGPLEWPRPLVTGGVSIYRSTHGKRLLPCSSCASTKSRTCVIFSQWGIARRQRHRVCERCQLWPLYSIDATWSRDSEHPFHLQLSTGIRWWGARLFVGPPLVTPWANSALFCLLSKYFLL